MKQIRAIEELATHWSVHTPILTISGSLLVSTGQGHCWLVFCE
jgi:hypothetical protein